MLRELGRASCDRAIGPHPRLAADATTQSPPVELTGAQPIEKPRGHAVAGEEPVRAGIVQRHYRLRSPAANDSAHTLMDRVQRQGP